MGLQKDTLPVREVFNDWDTWHDRNPSNVDFVKDENDVKDDPQRQHYDDDCAIPGILHAAPADRNENKDRGS
jgi:hypothetical protein